MKRWLVAGAVVTAAAGLVVARAGVRWWRLGEAREACERCDKTPSSQSPVGISPDYRDVVIPRNIAPLNFTVLEPGVQYYVRACAPPSSNVAETRSDSPTIQLPPADWRAVLDDAAVLRKPLLITVVVQRASGEWRWDQFTLTVAEEPIDPYLVNRVIPPLYNYWAEIEIRQRNLESFEERTVLHNRMAEDACVNCHSFRGNHPDRMTLGIRSGTVGSSTVLVRDGEVEKVGTKFGYTAWHPSGLVAAYSANEVRQFFHWAGAEVRDVVDLDSGIAYYDLRTQTAKTTPGLSDDGRLETYPTWSPDGKWLYFCSAAFPWQNRRQVPPENFDQCRYDLRRISYDVAADRWGTAQTVLRAEALGKSLLLPRVSPDGRWVLFCASDYGCFPIFQPSSDLHLLDLRTGAHRPVDALNSPRSESWHSWSSNGRWVAFSSKRRDGLFTRTYLSYVDAAGTFHKPFVVPQKDPTAHDAYLKTYTVPELLTEPVPVRSQQLAQAIVDPTQIKVDSPITFGAAPGGAGKAEAAWRLGRR